MGLGLQIASGDVFSNTSLLSAVYYYNIFWRWKEDNDHDADWYIIFSVFQYVPVFFNIFAKMKRRCWLIQSKVRTHYHRKWLHPPQENMIALRASSALEAMILSQPKLFLFIGRWSFYRQRDGAKVKEFDTDLEVRSRIWQDLGKKKVSEFFWGAMVYPHINWLFRRSLKFDFRFSWVPLGGHR